MLTRGRLDKSDERLIGASASDVRERAGDRQDQVDRQRDEDRHQAAWHTAARDAFVAVTSAAVVAFLVFYAFSRPEVAIRASVGSLEASPGQSAVVHGRIIEADGDAVSGAQLKVWRRGSPPRTTTTGERGFFRLNLQGGCGIYEIDLSARSGGRSLGRRLAHRLCPGQALEVEGRIVASGNFVWVPTR